MTVNPLAGSRRLIALHFLVWALILAVSFFSMLPEDGPLRSFLWAVNSCSFYAFVIYGNIAFLFPRYYQTKNYVVYGLGVLILLLAAALGRGYVSACIGAGFAHAPRWANLRGNVSLLFPIISVFILSFVFRLAMAYFVLKRQSEEILLQRSQTELKLLKAQVQPHFLFNTLNNMYYEAFLEAPRAALLIERLSAIMRYFVDHSPKEFVRLATEVEFIDNYLALETVRINPEPCIDFHRSFDGEQTVPPMLLMTFVENIFKHGIDKIAGNNEIYLSLVAVDGWIVFETKNRLNRHADPRQGEGLGLKNLRQRLEILYGRNFELHTVRDAEYFTASLKFPLT